MREAVTLNGMVLLSAPSGEFDRRLVLLTTGQGERSLPLPTGPGDRGNPLMACTRTFVFGKFTLYEGRTAYNLQSAQVANYFDELSSDMEGACYGSYFLELADFYSQENMDATEQLKLLYQSLRALLKPAIPNRLVRRIFELKMMVINGEYTEQPLSPVSDSCAYAWEYVVLSPVEGLYRFALTDEVLREFERVVESGRRRFLRHECRSLEILEVLTSD